MFLSIIIPVFNVERQLAKCLDSILRINFLDYEIILVISDSYDKSNDICTQYENKYNNIKIVTQTSKGLSNARNCGLLEAYGQYVTFMDSDDYVITESFEKLIINLRKVENFEMIVSDFYIVNNEYKVIKERNQIRSNRILSESYTKEFLNNNESIWNVWRYIYSSEYLIKNNMHFKEGFLCEDVDFTVRNFLQAQNILYSHNPYYCYCINREGSLINTLKLKNILDLNEIIKDLLIIMENKKSKYDFLIKEKLIREFLFYLPNIYVIDEKDRELAIKLYKQDLYLVKKCSTMKYRVIYNLLCVIGIKTVARIMYYIKKLRRLIIYRK